MRQIVLAAAGELRVQEGPLPEPGPGELRVRAQAVGICGSDLDAFADEHPFIELLVVPGHEAAGLVDAVGPYGDRRPAACSCAGSRPSSRPRLRGGRPDSSRTAPPGQ